MLETVFFIVNFLIFLCWIPLLVSPFSKFTQTFIHSWWLWSICGFVYLTMLIVFGQEIDWMKLAMPNLEGISLLLSIKEIGAIAWVHLLIFDLFAGRYIVSDVSSKKRLVRPFLIITLMAGPLGLSLYLVFRRYRNGHFRI